MPDTEEPVYYSLAVLLGEGDISLSFKEYKYGINLYDEGVKEMVDKISMYKVSCPICKKQMIESAESDSVIKCSCGASYNIWIHKDMICIQQIGVTEDRKMVQASRRRKYASLFEMENN